MPPPIRRFADAACRATIPYIDQQRIGNNTNDNASDGSSATLICIIIFTYATFFRLFSLRRR